MATVKVPVSKATGEYLEIDTDRVPPEMWNEVVVQGLKQLLGRGMSKISKTTYPDKDQLRAAAVAKARDNVEAIMANDQKKIRLTGAPKAKAAGGSKAIETEAMRLARNLVKDEMKKLKLKLSDYKASEISKAAKVYLENDPSIYEQAKANLAERETVNVGEKVDLKSILVASPELVAKAQEKKAKAKAEKGLSAKQAGITAKRNKPGSQPTAH